MRLNRTDIFPLFVIIGAGVVAVGVSGALVASASHHQVSASLQPVVAPESTPVEPVVESGPTRVEPVWSPDGTTLMWSAGGTWGALECSAGDASARRLPRSEVEPFYVAVSPDGRWLTYENRYRQVQVRPRGNEQLCVGTDGKARIVRRVAEVTVRSTPITFVDGVRVDGAFFMQSVNPDDIDNIEVIKGKAAVGLYGQAASEGVILIRLKQGRQRR